MYAPDFEIAHREDDRCADVASLGVARAPDVLLETARCGGCHHPVHLGYVALHAHLCHLTMSGDLTGLDARQREATQQR